MMKLKRFLIWLVFFLALPVGVFAQSGLHVVSMDTSQDYSVTIKFCDTSSSWTVKSIVTEWNDDSDGQVVWRGTTYDTVWDMRWHGHAPTNLPSGKTPADYGFLAPSNFIVSINPSSPDNLQHGDTITVTVTQTNHSIQDYVVVHVTSESDDSIGHRVNIGGNNWDTVYEHQWQFSSQWLAFHPATNQWSYLIALPTDDVKLGQSVQPSSFTFYSSGNDVKFNFTAETFDRNLKVYSIDGRELKRSLVPRESTSTQLNLHAGIYFVVLGNNISKISIY